MVTVDVKEGAAFEELYDRMKTLLKEQMEACNVRT